MSTIDIGIADTPQPIQTRTDSAALALLDKATASVVDDRFFYVGSVKLEHHETSPAQQQPTQ